MISGVGADVERLKVGGVVYVRLPEVSPGYWAEYVIAEEFFVAHKSASLSFVEAASVPLTAIIALQALRLYEGDI